MKVIKSDSLGVYALENILKDLYFKQGAMLIWQMQPETGKRIITETQFLSIAADSMQLKLSPDIHFHLKLPLYFFSEHGNFIFKTTILNLQKDVLTTAIPQELKLLEDETPEFLKGRWKVDHLPGHLSGGVKKSRDLAPDYLKVKSMAERSSRDQDFLNNEFNSISLDEEDKLFAEKRESPRARPKLEKRVMVKSSLSENALTLKLFDLSRGGIGFMTMDTQYFPIGSKVNIIGFDEFNLDDPLVAQVMSHRPVDEMQVEFKIGCKFDDGQAL